MIDRLFFTTILFFIFLAPFHIRTDIYDFANLPQSVWIQTGALILISVWFLKEIIYKKSVLKISPFFLPVFSILLWALISLFWATNKYEGVINLLQWAGPAAFMFLLTQAVKTKKECNYIVYTLFWSGFVVAMIGIFQHLFGMELIPQAIKPSSTFAHKNMAIEYIIMIIPVGIAIVIKSSHLLYQWLYLGASSLIITYLIYTYTRAGFVALFVQIIFCFALMLIKIIRFKNGFNGFEIKNGFNGFNINKKLLLQLITGLFVVCIMIKIAPSIDYERQVNETKDFFKTVLSETPESNKKTPELNKETPTKKSAISIRLATWRNTIEMIKDNFFFGVGNGNFSIHYPLYHRKVLIDQSFDEFMQMVDTHNDYLQTWAELGIIGILLWIWLGFVMVSEFMKLVGSDIEDKYLYIAISTGIIGILIDACFSFPFRRALPPFVFMIYLGLLCIINACAISEHGTKSLIRQFEIKSFFGFPIILFFCVIVSVVFTGMSLKWIECDRYYLRINSFERMNNPKPIIQLSIEALKLNPYRIRIKSNLGLAYLKSGNNEKAIESFDDLIKKYPNHTNALFNMGVAYFNIADYQKAESTFKKVISIMPEYYNAWYNIGHVYLREKKYDFSIEAFKNAINFGSYGSAGANYYIGLIYLYYLDQNEKSLPFFKEAIKNDPNIKEGQIIRDIIEASDKSLSFAQRHLKAKFCNDQGNTLMSRNQFEEAFALYKLASLYEPDDATVQFNIGLSSIKIGLYEISLKGFQKAFELKPDWDLACKNIGVVLMKYLHKTEQGSYYFRKALELNPNIEGNREMKILLERFGN